MAREETLQLLGSLIDKLQPIGAMTPGQPIRAADWNSLVDAVRTVARVAVARERTTDEFLDDRYSRSDHQHLGQMGLNWFDAPTRVLVEQGLQGSVEQRAAVDQVRNEMGQLRASVDELRQQLNQLRIDVDGLRDRDAARSRNLDRVSSRVEALRDVETRVSGLDQRLGTMTTGIEQVLAFRAELVDETGVPINIRQFGRRITELEVIRQNLMLASGNLVQIREIESALARLEENAIGRRDIDDAVANRLRDRAALQQVGLIDAVREGVQDTFTPRFSQIDARTAELTERIDGVSGSVNGHEGRLQAHDARLVSAEGQIGALAVLPERLTAQQGRLSDVETRLAAAQTALADLPAFRTELNQIRSDVTGIANIAGALPQINERLTGLEANTLTINQLVTTTETSSQRLATIEQTLPELRQAAATVGQHAALLGQLNTRVTANEAELDNLRRLPNITDTLSAQLGGLLEFRTTTTQRLNELTNRTSGITALVDRVAATERLAAETRNSLARINDQFSEIGVRLDRVDPRVVRPGRIG